MTPPYTIELMYFRSNGRFYTSGIYETNKESMKEVVEEVRDMHKNGNLPELTPGDGSEFIVVINTENHPNGYPALIRELE